MSTENELNAFLSASEQFFQTYRQKAATIEEHFKTWQNNTPCGSTEDYIRYCFAEAAMYIAMHAPDEVTGLEWKLEIDTKLWEFNRVMQSTEANYYLQQMHVDKLLAAKHSIPFEFDIAIDSEDCCVYCSKYHLQQVTLESIIEGKHLPYKHCKNKDHCTCTYNIIPH